MNKENIYFNIAFIVVFGFLLATINSVVSARFSSEMKSINELERQLQIKEAFAAQKSPQELSERMKKSIPASLDKSAITLALDQFARESNVRMPSLSVEETKKQAVSLGDTAGTSSVSEAVNIPVEMTNTLRSATIEVSIEGGRREIYAFIQKILTANPYMEVTDLSLSFDKGLGAVEGNITAITYYTGL